MLQGKRSDGTVRVVVMGVSGSGKSTIGALIADAMNFPFMDGSALHPMANVSKLASGTPLEDADRWPWLEVIGNELASTTAKGLVIACSARKLSYREAIRAKAPGTIFVHLTASLDVLSTRLEGRSGHSASRELIAAQLRDFEDPAGEEYTIVIDLGVGIASVLEQAVAQIKALAASQDRADG